MRPIFFLFGILLCVLLAACGDTPTSVAQNITPLATTPIAADSLTALPGTSVANTSVVTSTTAAIAVTNTDPIVSATASTAVAVPPTLTSSANGSLPPNTPQVAASTRDSSVPAVPATATAAPPKTVSATIKPYVPATAANGLPVTATAAYTLPTPPPTQPQAGGGQMPGTPLMLPTSAVPPYGDYPTNSLLVVQVFLASFQLEPSGKNSTVYLSTALRAKVAQGTAVLSLMNIPAMYTGFGVQGEPDSGRARVLLQVNTEVMTRTLTLVRENGRWYIDNFATG